MIKMSKFASLTAIIAVCAIVQGQSAGANGTGPAFTDTRVSPVGSDKLTVTLLASSDSWNVDLILNSSDIETNGLLSVGVAYYQIWSGVGPNDAQKTFNTLGSYINTQFNNIPVYYQYVFHDHNSATNVNYDLHGPVYNYTAGM